MKCNECKAAYNGKCKAGIIPYVLRCGEKGCCCNTKQVEKYMRDEQEKENADAEN